MYIRREVEVNKELPVPINRKQLRSALGLFIVITAVISK